MEKKPHKHAAIIKAWADGEEIEFRAPGCTAWVSSAAPAFAEDYDYRVKPAREYPEIALQDEQLVTMLGSAPMAAQTTARMTRYVANAAIRHAIDNGQVVTREEFKRVSDEANKAVRSLTAYGYTDEGGDLWEPPLGLMVKVRRNG